MTNEVGDLKKARQKRRQKTGWTIEEIRADADKRLKKYIELAKDEPDNLVSGDMKKAIEGDDDDEEC